MNLVDVFVTTTPGRGELTRRSLESLREHWDDSIRLTLYADGGDDHLPHDLLTMADHAIVSNTREGLPMAINRCLAHIDATNTYYGASRGAQDTDRVSDFVCMVQDDIEYTPGWLHRLRSSFVFYENRVPPAGHATGTGGRLGFASGVECVEHPARGYMSGGMLLKDYIRAANMFGRRDYWMSMYPIPRFDPETGRVRAFPNDGIGSGVDWHFIRNHPSSVAKTGRTCLVIPGLLRHIGYRDSTWLDRDLPESPADVEAMAGLTRDTIDG